MSSSTVNERQDLELSAQDTDLADHLMAAVDLGSNSFHMVICRYEHGQFTVVDRHKEAVRIAAGLDENNILSYEVAARALQTLSEFAQLLRTLKKTQVRVVATNAFRRMANKGSFLEEAERILGHNIEIIAGREEARLIYLGVSKWSEMGDDKRLVMDIGGGSTEVIIGSGDTPIVRESLEVGCVVMTNRYFADGALTEARFLGAKLAAELAMMPVVADFKKQGWVTALGCSGTMKSMATIIAKQGWCKEGITRESLNQLYRYVLERGHINNLELDGLDGDRRLVFAGGLSVLMALFELFDLSAIAVSEIALREGVLYDLIGRDSSQDTRQNTVDMFLQRWPVDETYGNAVKATALQFYDQVAVAWGIEDDLYRKILAWGAQLHQIGQLISHDRYHQHAAYVLENADMAGFAKRDQLLLAALIHGHRRKFPLKKFESLPSVLVTPGTRLTVLLRLAVLLHRGRVSDLGKEIQIEVNGAALNLAFEPGWLASHPLTKADLDIEKERLSTVGIKLSVS